MMVTTAPSVYLHSWDDKTVPPLCSVFKLGIDITELECQAAPNLDMLNPLLGLGCKSSMLVILKLVHKLIDNILDPERQFPDLVDEDTNN